MAYLMDSLNLRRQMFAFPLATATDQWSQWYGDKLVRYYSFGRFAMLRGLQALGLKPGSRVLLPGFICFEVVETLIQAGIVVEFYQVSDQFLPIDLDRHGDCQAVVAVNYFGFPQSLTSISQYAQKTNCAIVEDNAHGLLSRDQKGSLLGTRGDIGIFSIRKTFPMDLHNGAALVINNLDRVQNAPSPLPESPLSRGQKLRRPLKWFIRRTSPWLNLEGDLSQVYRTFKGWRKSQPATSLSTASMTAYQFDQSENPVEGLVAKLQSYDLEQEVHRRQALYRKLASGVISAGARPVFDELPSFVCPFALPFRVDRQAARIQTFAYLRSYGLTAKLWPFLPSQLKEIPQHYRDVYFIPLSVGC